MVLRVTDSDILLAAAVRTADRLIGDKDMNKALEYFKEAYVAASPSADVAGYGPIPITLPQYDRRYAVLTSFKPMIAASSAMTSSRVSLDISSSMSGERLSGTRLLACLVRLTASHRRCSFAETVDIIRKQNEIYLKAGTFQHYYSQNALALLVLLLHLEQYDKVEQEYKQLQE